MQHTEPITYTKEQVSKRNTSDSAWIIVHNKVYDITDFIESHPGGSHVLEERFGTDVTEVMQDEVYHQHSESAYSMMANYYIGRIEGTKQEEDEDLQRGWGKVDMHKPLVHQVGLLGKEYAMWAETEPLHFKESVRLFENSLMEMLSRTPWYVVPILWGPVVAALLGFTISRGTNMSEIALSFTFGNIIWYLIEWILHRFLFHWWGFAQYGNYYTNIVHFLLHGFHHKIPMDTLRLVLPPALLVVLSSPFIYLAFTLFSAPVASAIFAGSYTGYIQYDMIHYWLHHSADIQNRLPQPFSSWWKNLHSHHMVHHFAAWNADINYGISNRILDQLFNTLRV